MQFDFIIGIDTGTSTGFAVWSMKEKKLTEVLTLKIHQAMELVLDYKKNSRILVRFEDARQRKWYGERSNFKLQGAGSVKRDCNIWSDFLIDHCIEHQAVNPAANRTKLKADQFKVLTGHTGKTSSHARDASMLVFNFR